MKRLLLDNKLFSKSLLLILVTFTYSCTTPAEQFSERVPERSMNVTSGPDLVFDRPVTDILPALGDALATGRNGRIGNEMVFWGYRLRDNREVNLFACAVLEDVDCEARISAICPGGNELIRVEEPGTVRHMNCTAIGVAAPGDIRPNCTDFESSDALLVGLMQC